MVDQVVAAAPSSSSSSFSLYAVMTSWLTPSFLFIFINLVIGTIAITSRFASKRQHQLARSPSLFHRLMSFNISSYNCSHEPIQNHDSPRFERVPSSSLFQRVRSFNLSFRQEATRPDPDEQDPQQLTRTPSLLDRIKSVTLCRSDSTKAVEKEHEPEPKPELNPESEPENTGEENLEEEEAVDAKADDFINRFKQQLRMQRLDSILRYRDMIKRY